MSWTGLRKSEGLTGQILPSAIACEIHNAARRGMMAHSPMKRELAELARGYLDNDRVITAKMK
jgi:hypothetical protein